MNRLLLLLLLPLFQKAQTPYFPPTNNNSWDTIAPAQLGFCESRLDSLKDFLESKGTKAFLLSKDGKLVIEWYLNNQQPSDNWYWASAGKTLTATMVGIAQQEGYLNINNAVSQYLGAGWTSLPPAKESLITVRHLLTMSSGLEFNVPDLNCTLPSCLLYRADAGTQWYYHNAPYLLLKDVVEAATGKNFNVYLNQTLGFAGINPVFLNTPTSPHVAFSLPRVMLRFGLLVQNRGIWENDTVFNSSYFTDWTQPSQTLNPGYGYLWWLNGSSTHRLPGFNISFPGPIVPNAPADAYMAAGLNEQRLYLVPSKGWAIVRMGEATGAPTAAISSFDDQLWAHLNWALCNPVGTNDQNHQKATLYPNPANEFLYVMGNLPKKATYTIKNTQGMVVKHGWADTKIAIADLATGLYFLEIHAQGGVFLMEKFAVQN